MLVHLHGVAPASGEAEHPLHRIMSIEAQDGTLVVRTTDIDLPRRIGEALRHAFHGELDLHYEEEAYFTRGQVEARELSGRCERQRPGSFSISSGTA